MKFGIASAVCFSTLILGTVLYLAGCATTGMQRSDNTRTTMKVVEQDYIQAIVQVDATGESLESLVNPGQPDEKAAFKKYSANVNRMEDMKNRLFNHADKMRVQQKDYFEEWRMQGNKYTNPQIQALSEQRRSDLSEVFSHISEASVGVKGAFKAYMSDIGQINVYLSNDLTPKGVESITQIAKNAVMDGAYLKDAVKPVLVAIGNAREELAQGGKN